MTPNTNYPEKAQSMADLIERLGLAADRLEASVAGLTDSECEGTFHADEWSIHECVTHVAGAALGWTDMLYEAVEDVYETPRKANLAWSAPLTAEAAQSMHSALAVYRRHGKAVGEFLNPMPPDDFLRPFKAVSWLTEPFSIKESVNWGLVIHCDFHLASIHCQRLAIGKPLDWMAVYLERFPRANLPRAMDGG